VFLGQVLAAWGRRQRAQDLSPDVIASRRRSVLRFTDFAGRYPWEWTIADADQFFAEARGVKNLAHNTVRRYQTDIKLFCDFATSPTYEWNGECARLFGSVFIQVITEQNRVRHSQTNEASSQKRPFTRLELEQLFELADLEYERILNSGRRGALAMLRDTVALKAAYAWGLRASELRHLQTVDFSRSAGTPYFGNFGALRVRWGKPHRGSAKKVRTVLTVFDWSVDVVRDWVSFGLPHYGHPVTDLFPTENGGLVGEPHLIRRLRRLVDELGFPPGLDLHSFRRSYATHLITEAGFDVTFVQMQLGHEHASTTSIYTVAAPDYQRRTLARAHQETLLAAMRSPAKGETR
jgi:site-specific recombinase XerD